MLLSIVVRTTLTSSSSSPYQSLRHSNNNSNAHSTAPSPYSTIVLPKSLLPGFEAHLLNKFLGSSSKRSSHRYLYSTGTKKWSSAVNASLIEAPIVWAGRLCVFYALLKAGLAGSQANPLVSELEGSDGVDGGGGLGDLGFSKWLGNLQSKPEKDAADRRKLVSKWHPTMKGTLRRNYRVPSKNEGRRLLKAIAALLSDDDHFRDATSHKGCQIRRENAHGESVCCNNVRALFDELPTPHLIVEITAFPAGPLTEKDYAKAEKLERVLRSGPSI